MTIFGRNDTNMEGMTIIQKELYRPISWKKNIAQILLLLVLLPLLCLNTQEAIGTLGYYKASKLEN